MHRKITVVGLGYVGISLAVLLAQHNQVTAIDIKEEKVEMLKRHVSPIQDELISEYLADRELDLTVSLDCDEAYREAEFLILAVPTDYDPEEGHFDCSAVESVIQRAAALNPEAVIVIKSTVPVGFTDSVRRKYGLRKLFFSPEFLREGKALYDSLYPSRIIVGNDVDDPHAAAAAEEFAALLKEGARKEGVEVLLMGNTEAEAVKLFANAYLAMRISFFNELDTYAETKGLDTRAIIEGVCLDPRIGDQYNNPSFGYGGYCLPKDTKQLLANYRDVPEDMIRSIVASNRTRKEYIADRAYAMANRRSASLGRKPIVGVYRLSMKSDSDDFRQSSVERIMEILRGRGAVVLVYEPALKGEELYKGYKVISDLARFKKASDIIIANRYHASLDDVKDKVYTRDLFCRD